MINALRCFVLVVMVQGCLAMPRRSERRTIDDPELSVTEGDSDAESVPVNERIRGCINSSSQTGGITDYKDTYSVIVVADNHHRSNLFRDRGRMCAFTEGVASVKFADSQSYYNATEFSGPFGVEHEAGVDKRVRILHMYNMNEGQVRATQC